MSARHALLGLLLDRPAYPYELANRLQERLGPAWRINSGQISQTIKAMEQEGLIEPVDGASADTRDRRRVVAITESGGKEFERWFAEIAHEVRLSRTPLLIKLTLAGGPERLKDALEQIDAYELDRVGELSELMRLKEESQLGGRQVRADHVLFRLNLNASIIQVEGELKFARHARETVCSLLAQDAVWPAAHAHSAAVDERERRNARKEIFGRMAARSDLPGRER